MLALAIPDSLRLLQIHVVVPQLLWILVNNNKAAIKRADRAEELARLQHHVAEMAGEKVREKRESRS